LLIEHLRNRILRHGPLSFRDSGQLSDFESELGEPGFTVVELGAGKGRLARDILTTRPFRYQILERSAAMRRRQREMLSGLDVEWIDELPANLTGCIFSNEFFDALPVHRVVRRGGVLRELYVTENFQEVEGEPSVSLDVPVSEGHVADINLEARAWMVRIGASLKRGYHLVIDYGYLHKEFYARPRGTLMCYWKHQVSEDPFSRIGEQDITAHVNFSDLIETGQSVGLECISFSTQMEFLNRLGILSEIEKLALAGTGDAIARLQAVKKLILPGAMGERFKTLIQRKESR
jgi:SAM-dependent MidA family methyltransferase